MSDFPGKPKSWPLTDQEPSSLDEAFQSQSTITPSSVLLQIREDVIRVLGLRPNISNAFTPLEEELIQAIEKVLRKGQCPSILVQSKPLFAAMLCLKKYYTREKLTVYLDRGNGQRESNLVIIFSALYQYARDAAFCAQKVRELTHIAKRIDEPSKRQNIKQKIDSLRERRDKDMLNFQKIVFLDAERQRDAQPSRSLIVHGQAVTLDQLIKFFKTGRKPEPETGKMPLASERSKHQHPDKQESSSEETEVLDWRQIRSKKVRDDETVTDKSKKYDFRL